MFGLRRLPTGAGVLLRLAAMALGFLQSLALARWTTPEVYGAYSMGMSLATLLAVFCCAGFETLSVKKIPALGASGKADAIPPFMHRCAMITLVLGIAAASVSALVVLATVDQGIVASALVMSSLLVPLTAGVRLIASQLRGLRRPLISQFVLFVGRPLVLVSLLALAWTTGLSLQLNHVIGFAIAGTVTTLLVGIVARSRSLASADDVRSSEPERSRDLILEALPFFFGAVTRTAMQETPTLILGLVNSPVEAGILQPILRIGMLLTLGHTVIAYSLAPRVSELWTTQRRGRIQLEVRRAARNSLLLTSLASIVVLIWADAILAFFGEPFVAGATGLRVIAAAQIVNALTGYGGLILGMTGYQRQVVVNNAGALVVVVLLSVLWGASMGALGCACAIACGIVVRNLLHLVMALRHTALNPSALATSARSPD